MNARRWKPAGVLAALILFAWMGWSASWLAQEVIGAPPSESDRASLEANQALGDASGIENYALTYNKICLCAFSNPFTVVVTSGVITSATDGAAGRCHLVRRSTSQGCSARWRSRSRDLSLRSR